MMSNLERLLADAQQMVDFATVTINALDKTASAYQILTHLNNPPKLAASGMSDAEKLEAVGHLAFNKARSLLTGNMRMVDLHVELLTDLERGVYDRNVKTRLTIERDHLQDTINKVRRANDAA